MNTIYIKNARNTQDYSIFITKVDCCDCEKPLCGAVFDLLLLDACRCTYTPVRENLCTDQNGQFGVVGLACGSYKLVEKCPPCGYSNGYMSSWNIDVNACTADESMVVSVLICNCKTECCDCCDCERKSEKVCRRILQDK